MEQYTVQKGDSLWKISRKFGIDVNELANINGLLTKAEQHIIQPGQVLSLPSKVSLSFASPSGRQTRSQILKVN